MNEERKVPGHWEYKKLGEMFEFVGGGTPSKKNPYFWNGNIFWASVKDVKGDYLNKTQDTITEKGLKNSASNIAEKGDVILITRIAPGKSIISNIKTAINQDLKIAKPKFKTTPKFIHYFFSSIERECINHSSGTTVLGITLNSLNELQIPNLSLPEQRAIVAKIEQLLSDLENGKQQLQTAQQQLKIYRQSLLNGIVTNKNTQKIESVIETLDQGWSPKCLNEQSQKNNEWAVIKTTAIQHGLFICNENKLLPKDLKPREQHELKTGDILITRAGPRIRVGVCCMVRKTRPKLINCDKVYRIKVNSQVILSEYLELILNTPFYQNEIEKMKTGINDSGVNLTQTRFLKIEIPVPSLETQRTTVSDLESRLTVCDKIEQTITQSLAQAETLRQSILKKAFEGKLTRLNHDSPDLHDGHDLNKNQGNTSIKKNQGTDKKVAA